MKLLNTCFMLAALALFMAGPATADDDAGIYRAVLEKNTPSIVTVKLVLKTKISFMGQGQDMEQTVEVPGAVVDASGLVMMAADPLSPGGPLASREEIEIKVKPVSLKVIFEDDDEEYDAILGAKDTQLNLAFVLIKDLGGKEVVPVPFAEGAEAEVGQELIGVSRYTKGFDYAAYFGTIRVTGEVVQPRPLWSIEGGFDGLGLPVFNRDGVVAGVIASQEGSEGAEEGGGGGPMGMLLMMDSMGPDVFLLPAAAVKATVDRAKTQAVEALKKQAEEAEEEKEEE